MPVLLAEKGMGQLGIGRLETLPLYSIVQKITSMIECVMLSEALQKQISFLRDTDNI
jgi:hypothetical protein